MKIKFDNENKKVEFLLVQYRNDDVESKIFNALTDQTDIILFFRPRNLQYYDGFLQSTTYRLTAVDVKTKRQVWEATYKSTTSFSPSIFAKNVAQNIFRKLKTDKVL